MTTWREELAWAAGFFDGEGSTYLNRQSDSRVAAQMVISQIDCEVLERFQGAVLGLGRIGAPYCREGHKPLYQWRVTSSANVQAVVAMLWPFLGTVKRKQARVVLEGMRWRQRGPRVTHCPQDHEYTPENTYETRDKKGYLVRQCRQCKREKMRTRRAPRRQSPTTGTPASRSAARPRTWRP